MAPDMGRPRGQHSPGPLPDSPPPSGEVTSTVAHRGDNLRVLALSDEREQWHKLALDYWRQGHRIGYGHGWKDGYEAAAADLEASYHEMALRVTRSGPDFAELERRRWGPGGREHFADPRPGDYSGRSDAA